MSQPNPTPNLPPATIPALRAVPMKQLIVRARELGIARAGNLPKRKLIFEILRAQVGTNGDLRAEGVLEVLPDGFGFLRGGDMGFVPGQDDVYVAPSHIRRHDLRPGDTVTGPIRAPRGQERYFALSAVETINFEPPVGIERPSFYEHLTPMHPVEHLRLEHDPAHLATRVMDILCPVGKGQRALIVSPPRAGKTELLRGIANAISINHPEVALLVLLVDERPEEVTETERAIDAEVVSSNFDEPAERHVRVAEVVLDRARRLAEQGRDVVVLLDSITRLARAYNTLYPSSGRVLSGGVDAGALHNPKRFFGAARNIEEGGSLTIIATALTDTGSRMDEVIFEEFKGTGNSELVLDRRLAERRVWPAIDINRSGTRKEELLLDPVMLQRIWILRKVLQPLGPEQAMQILSERLANTESNEQFLTSMSDPA